MQYNNNAFLQSYIKELVDNDIEKKNILTKKYYKF